MEKMQEEQEQYSTQPKQIFILSGQSNMAGRGGVHNHHWDHRVPQESQPNPCILRFTAHSKWVVAEEPLHIDIDVHKTCGVGPGMPFARSLPPTPVGLVPCAVGGTAIAEWERGGKLYGQMIARARAAVGAAGCGEIRAVLWYQGESDTNDNGRADAYRGRMEKLIADVRGDLGLPSLPFVQVALASGGDEALVRQVREAQLAIDLPNVVCVDAMGLPLNADRLHLTTDAQVVLGKMLAQAYLTRFCQGRATSFSSSSHSPASLMSCRRSQSTIATPAASYFNGRPPQWTLYTEQAMGSSFSTCWNYYKPDYCGSFKWHNLEAGDYGKEVLVNLLQPTADLRCKIHEVQSTKLPMQLHEQLIQTKWSSYWIIITCLLIVLVLFLLSVLIFVSM